MSGSNSPTQVKPVKDYGVTNSPILDHSQKVEEFVTRAQPEASRPTRPRVQIVTKAQSEASRPTRPRLQIVTNWHNNKPKAMGQGADYTNKNNNNNNDWNKPSGNTIRDESLADPFIAENKPISGNTIRDESLTDRFIAKNKPISGNTILDESLTDPFIAKNKEAAKPWAVPAIAPAAPQPRMTVLDSTVPKRDTDIATIDGREAQRRYGGTLDRSSRPIQAQETYTGTIDSKEAEQKYNGRRIP